MGRPSFSGRSRQASRKRLPWECWARPVLHPTPGASWYCPLNGWGETPSSRAGSSKFPVSRFQIGLETWDSQLAREDTRPTEVDPHEVVRWGRRESWEPRTECFQLLALRE